MNKPKPSILLIDDDPNIHAAVKLELGEHMNIRSAHSSSEAFDGLGQHQADLVLLDIHLASENGLSILPKITQSHPNIPVLMLTALRDKKSISQALKDGARDYVSKPFEGDDLLRSVRQALNPLAEQETPHEFIGRSMAVRRLRTLAEKAAQSQCNVLIIGESGTGKEVLARMIHRMSGEKDRPFVPVNCAAIPKDLMESTFFGHEKGAFTGAIDTKRGKFESADGGDIFLDEIGSMPLELQAKLLRVLQEKEFERVGGDRFLQSDFRVISASNEDLYALKFKNLFREDLIYRLNSLELRVPPLRERPEDIPLLINHYLGLKDKNPEGKKISAETRGTLAAYPWPGNARQLFHTLDHMILLSETKELTTEDIPKHLIEQQHAPMESATSAKPLSEFRLALDEYERKWIQRAIDEAGSNYTDAAKKLDITRSSLYVRMKRLGVQ